MKKKKILFIVGPTGSGKSRFALYAARRLKGSIISADSMQVYQGMDVGTAKPSVEERGSIPHYLLDVIPPTQTYSAHQWRQDALEAVDDIFSAGRFPIVVGGTGFYIKSLIEGLSEENLMDKEARKKLERVKEKKGIAHLYKRLCSKDPKSAKRIHENDEKRIIRALEICETTGTSRTDFISKKISLSQLGYASKVIGIQLDRDALYQKINARVDQMVLNGLIPEVKSLGKKKLSSTARKSIYFKEIQSFLKKENSLENSLEELKKNSRHYAKRQLTWFRHQSKVSWIDANNKTLGQMYSQMQLKLKDWL